MKCLAYCKSLKSFSVPETYFESSKWNILAHEDQLRCFILEIQISKCLDMLRSNESSHYQIIAQKCNLKELMHAEDDVCQVIKIFFL